jgi:rod shape-determining protein MreB and related proteins
VAYRLFGALTHDIGIDLGTSNTLVYVKGRGIMIDEPSVVAIDKRTKRVLQVGAEAKKMQGRTPASLAVVRPLVDGVVSDFEVTEQMLRYFIGRVHQEAFSLLPRPRAIITVPSGITEVERRAVEDAAAGGGARSVLLVEEPIAAALGARLPIREPAGTVIVDIGGGTTEVAVLSLGGIVSSRSINVAGDRCNEDIIRFARDEFGLLLGERTAEEIKHKIGAAYIVGHRRLEGHLRGRDLVTGLPKSVLVTGEQLNQALSGTLQRILDTIRGAIEEAPPELVADLMERGITLTGGGALLQGLDRLIAAEIGMPVHLADDPLTCVVRGTGSLLEDLESGRDLLLIPRPARALS